MGSSGIGIIGTTSINNLDSSFTRSISVFLILFHTSPLFYIFLIADFYTKLYTIIIS